MGITLDAGSGGATLGTDTVSGSPTTDYQIIKLGFSVSGNTPAQVSLLAGLPTTPGNVTPADHADVSVPAALSAPVQSVPTTTSGGSLAAGTYYYVITALNAEGETTASNEKSIAVAVNGEVLLSWAAVTGATGYRVYRGTGAGAENVYYAPGNQTTYTDTGAVSSAGSPPAFNSTSTDTTVIANAGRKSVTVCNLSGSPGAMRLRLHGSNQGGIEIQPGMSYNLPTQSALDVYNPGNAAVTYGWQEYE